MVDGAETDEDERTLVGSDNAAYCRIASVFCSPKTTVEFDWLSAKRRCLLNRQMVSESGAGFRPFSNQNQPLLRCCRNNTTRRLLKLREAVVEVFFWCLMPCSCLHCHVTAQPSSRQGSCTKRQGAEYAQTVKAGGSGAGHVEWWSTGGELDVRNGY
jgi:hypothetical protein